LAPNENALRCAGAHGKASVPECLGVPVTSSMIGIRRLNTTGLERPCRMPARLATVDAGIGGEGRHQDTHRVSVNLAQAAIEFHATHALRLVVE
jgi:hypothetical protein